MIRPAAAQRSAWTISPCAAATATPRSSRMPRPTGASWSCPTARRPPWSPGCANILVPRSCAGTARPPMPRPSAEPCPTRCRSATDGTSGEISATTPARGPRPRRMLGHHQPAPPRQSTRADHTRTLEQDPRSPRPGRRPARLLPQPQPGPEHRQTLRPHARTPGPAHRPPTGPPSSTPTASTCVGAVPRIPPSRSPTSSRRSGSWATPAAPTLPLPKTHPPWL